MENINECFQKDFAMNMSWIIMTKLITLGDHFKRKFKKNNFEYSKKYISLFLVLNYSTFLMNILNLNSRNLFLKNWNGSLGCISMFSSNTEKLIRFYFRVGEIFLMISVNLSRFD